jgi:hypothetical protein
VDVLVVHGNASALLRVLGGRLAETKVVPGIVGDVVSTTGRVNLEEIDGAALVGDLDADVVAVNGTGPVGNAVGVDLAAENSDAAGVLVVGSDAGRARVASGKGTGRDQSGRSSEEGGELGEHVDGLWRKVFQKLFIYLKCKCDSETGSTCLISQRAAERSSECKWVRTDLRSRTGATASRVNE